MEGTPGTTPLHCTWGHALGSHMFSLNLASLTNIDNNTANRFDNHAVTEIHYHV